VVDDAPPVRWWSDRIVGVETAQGDRIASDAYAFSMGGFTPTLLRPPGSTCRSNPVEGYSLTLPVTDPEAAPVSTAMDGTCKVAITRLADRIRVGGTAEFAGFSQSLRATRRETLAHSVSDLFPAGGNLTRAKF
jgi:D-amino-acid dehydrogenase